MKAKITILLLFLSVLVATKSYAHCEVPCGIYNDQLRVELLMEHFKTIEKAMNKINILSKKSPVDYNQVVRWVNTKEEHANKIQKIVFQYFMTQRIKIKQSKDKPAYDKYIRQITLAHSMLINAMKAKQTTDVKYVNILRKTLHQFIEVYFTKEDLKHLKEHIDHKH